MTEVRTLARRAACALASICDVPAADFFRATRGNAEESFARQILVYILHTQIGLTEEAIATAFDRDRSTVGHGVRTLEELRDPEVDRDLLRRRLIMIHPKDEIEVRARFIRSGAYLIAAVFDVGFPAMKDGTDPDEMLARQVLFWITRETGLVRRADVVRETGRNASTVQRGENTVQALHGSKELRALFKEIARLWGDCLSLRDRRRKMAPQIVMAEGETEPRQVFAATADDVDLWLDDVAIVVGDVLTLAAAIDHEIAARIVKEAKIPRTRSPTDDTVKPRRISPHKGAAKLDTQQLGDRLVRLSRRGAGNAVRH